MKFSTPIIYQTPLFNNSIAGFSYKCYLIIMKKTALILSKIAYIIGILILFGITVGSIIHTYTTDLINLDNSQVTRTADSPILTLCLILVLGALLFFFTGLFFKNVPEEKKPRRAILFSAVISGLLFIILTVWVLITLIEPYWDQAQVYLDALAFNEGDFSDMNNAYLKMYPQQYGLIFFEGILLRIFPHFGTLQVFNALFVALTVFLVGRIVYFISDNSEASAYASLITAVFAPLSYYVSFVYGDVFLAFSISIITYLVLKWFKTGKWFLPLIALFFAVVTIPVRENGLIFIIALSILFLVKAIHDKKALYICIIPFFVLLPLLVNSGIHSYYEHKSGIALPEDSVPSINWIAMGLQGDVYEGQGVGYYNGYNYYSFQMCGQDTEATIEYTRNIMAERFDEFKASPKMFVDFMLYKAGEQWLEPFFGAPQMTGSQLTKKNARIGKLLYSGKSLKMMTKVLNILDAFIYFGALLYGIYYIRHEKETAVLLPLVTFIGGFLFSLFWEANGRYTMPFFVALIPLGALGYAKTIELIRTLIRKKDNTGKEKTE